MSTTVRDVAIRAGVSIATVSRVVNNPTAVSVRTKDKVMEVISTLHYRPNPVAAHLSRHRLHQKKTHGAAEDSASLVQQTQGFSKSKRMAHQLRTLRKDNRELRRLIRKMSKDLNRWADQSEG